MKIAIIGGTGHEGAGLGFRWAARGHEVILGSRSAEKAHQTVDELKTQLPSALLRGTDNLTAAQSGEVVVLSVPYSAQQSTLAELREALAGKLVISVVVPLMPPKVSQVWHPAGGSAAQEAQAEVAEGTRIVAAFQNISATHLRDLEHTIDCDVLIAGDLKEDKAVVSQLCAEAGMRGVDAGPLVNASVLEGLTAVLIGINARHKIKNAGIRITGV